MKSAVRKWMVMLAKQLARFGLSIPERVFRHLHFQGPFKIALPNGSTLQLYSWGNRVENELAWRGWNGHEKTERERWVQMLSRPGDVLDIGANTGTFAFTAKAILPAARVVAFEPIRRIADRVRQNADVSGLEVEVVEAAVANVPGELPIYDPGGANAYSASLEPDFLDGEKDVYKVPVVSIDVFCAEHGLRPSVMKIDVEGSEAKALLGARQVLARHETLVLCEWLGNSDDHIRAAELLSEIGLVAVDLVTLDEIDASQTATFGERNIIIGPAETIKELPPLS